MSHIASICRMAHQQKTTEMERTEGLCHEEEPSSSSSVPREVNENQGELAHMSVMSLSDDYDLSNEFRTERSKITQSQSSTKRMIGQKSIPPPIEPLTQVSDVEAFLDSKFHQLNTIQMLEERWNQIITNFDVVVRHLHECSKQMLESSTQCLGSLAESVEFTCDRVDSELKAMYHLMTKCDELTTKLSVATSFRDEIKTLRKSVETLEQLYKSRPQPDRIKASTTRGQSSGLF